MSYLSIDTGRLLQDLRSDALEIVFDKVEGDRRIMKCTLNQRLIPEQFDFNHYKTVQPKGNVIAVWDLDQNGWRSFYLDRVLSCQLMPGYN